MQIRNLQKRSHAAALRTAAVLLFAAVALLFFRKPALQAAVVLFGAGLIAFLLAPLCICMEAKLSRKSATLLVLLVILLAAVVFSSLLLPGLMRQAASLSTVLPKAFLRLSGLAESIEADIQAHFPGFRLPQLDLNGMEATLAETARGAIETVSGLAGGIYRLFLMVVLSYFLLADRERIFLRAELLVPFGWRRFAVCAGNTLLRELRLYLRGQATIALAVGTLAGFAMFCIGLQGAPLLGLIVGIFNVIPYFGPILGGIPAVISALSLGWKHTWLTVLALFLVQQIDGFLISPRVMGNITGFSPAVVLIVVFLGGQTGGIVGMLFALPLLLGIRTLYRVFVQQYENN